MSNIRRGKNGQAISQENSFFSVEDIGEKARSNKGQNYVNFGNSVLPSRNRVDKSCS